jgi:hypothetical protein
MRQLTDTDKEYCIKQLQKNGLLLLIVDDTLLHDFDILSCAISNNHLAFDNIPEKLKYDKNFILKIIKESPKIISMLSYEFRDDIDIVLECIKQNGELLQCASHRLRNNKDVVIAAVTNKDYQPSYFHIGLNLLKDVTICKAIIRN